MDFECVRFILHDVSVSSVLEFSSRRDLQGSVVREPFPSSRRAFQPSSPDVFYGTLSAVARRDSFFFRILVSFNSVSKD